MRRTYALVLELVEGPTLADRIAQGPLPLDEALPIARQIAEALEAAHEQRIIHRDLKPANIKLRPDGTVKVLDFGLAEVAPRPIRLGAAVAARRARRVGIARHSRHGRYMSPEQARGKGIDKRCDIWAFGCVLYEMLTGRRPFEGRMSPDDPRARRRARAGLRCAAGGHSHADSASAAALPGEGSSQASAGYRRGTHRDRRCPRGAG